MWGAVIGGIASVAGGMLSAKGQSDTNSANVAMSREQMDFQERMRDTSYQAAVKDMRKAGINPMVAYSQGGAATPSGAAIAQQNPYAPFANAGQGVQSAIAAEKLETELDLARSVTEKNLADAGLANEASLNKFYERGNLMAQQRQLEENIKNIQADTDNKWSTNKILHENLVTAKGQAARARLEAEIDNTKYGEIMRYLDRIPIPFVNSAKGMIPK